MIAVSLEEIIFAKSGLSGNSMSMKACRSIRWLGWAALLVGVAVGRLSAASDGESRMIYATADTGKSKILSSPAISPDGTTLYVGVCMTTTAQTGLLVAIDLASQRPKSGWPINGYATPEWVVSSPAVGPDGTVYFGCYDGYLYALNGANGSLKWKKRLGYIVTSSPSLSADGTIIYIGSEGFSSNDDISGDNGLHAVGSDGNPIWTFKTKAYVESTPAISSDGTLYFGCGDQYIYAVDSSGALKWRVLTGSSVKSSPAIGADGTVYIGSYDGYFYALLPEKGELKWRFEVGKVVHASPALGPDGTIYFGALTSNFYALNPDGSQRWSPVSTGNWIFSSAAVRSDGVVIFGSDDGVVRALNVEDATVKWAKQASERVPIDSSPVIAKDGSVYVGSNDGNVYGWFGSNAPASLYSRWPMFRHDAEHSGRASVVPEGGRLVNLSTRAQAGEGKNLIAGLVTGGAGAKSYLIRGVGLPLASRFGVPNPLRDPSLVIRSNGFDGALASNDDWGLATNADQIRQKTAEVGAFSLEEGSKDAVVLRPLEGGLFTATLGGAPGESGIALVEAYDADINTAGARLLNLSSRAQVGSADGQFLIAGLVIGGSAPIRVMVRGIGPGLANFGVADVLAKPTLSVFSPGKEKSELITTNTGWSTSVLKGDVAGMASLVGAFPLTKDSADCAALLTLNPGAYTIQVSGVDGTTGEALVEVYLLP